MASPAQGKIGLVLSGGGARGAYQAGVMKAIAEISEQVGVKQPTPIVTGVSAGAVNAAFLAAEINDFQVACDRMAMMWSKITAEQIFRTDALSAGRSGLRFITDATVGALYAKKLARSLLDTAPLKTFLTENVNFNRIKENLRAGHFESLAVTAMNYTTSNSITFVHGHENAPMWQRSRRQSEATPVSADHVMASAAIPMFFPPVKVGDGHYGDGCLRNTAPLSPAIHLGADRLLVISVRKADTPQAQPVTDLEPSLARVIGVILNALLLDSTEIDMERMSRVNSTINFVPERQRSDLALRKVDYLWLKPSRDIGELAGDLFNRLPRVIRYLVGGLGSSREASELTSYLLFDPDFCGQLVHMGYEDTIANSAAVAAFIAGRPPTP